MQLETTEETTERSETFSESKSKNFLLSNTRVLTITDLPSPSMAALGARFVGNHRLLSEEDRFLNHRVMRISRSARPAAISCCTDSGGGKMSIKALAKLESISKATLPACIEGEERRALAMKTMEHWMRESVVEIVQNLRGSSSLLAEVYTEGRGGEFTLKIGKAGAEDWPEIKEKWKKGETSSPDGIIVVEELKDEGEEDTKVKKEERFWGLMVQGKGFDCAPCCYVLKTNRPNTNLHISCTYFVLIKVQNFNDSAKSQIDRSFLVE